MRSTRSQVVVAGGGPAGLTAALALARAGVAVTLVAPSFPQPAVTSPLPEPRTAALFPQSTAFLRRLGVWNAVADRTASLRAIRLVDDTGGLLRAPEIVFTAADLGLDALAHNVPLAPLIAALEVVASQDPAIRRIATTVTAVVAEARQSVVTLADGSTMAADLVVAADGRNSAVRAATGIATRAWTYDQTALVAAFEHSRPHRNISTEIHRRAGPCTVVPLPGSASSLVWLERPAEAERLVSLEDMAFRRELEQRLGGLLGTIGALGGRQTIPMAGLAAEQMGGRRTALVGETAHAFPPIGAQGLNLTLRDVATLAELVGDAITSGGDIGSSELLDRYTRGRRGDIEARVFGVDALNRSLLAGLVGIDLMRGAGLHVLHAVPRLRSFVMRQGMLPVGAVPRSMQPFTA